MNVLPTEGITRQVTPPPENTLVPLPEIEKRIVFGPGSWFILISIGILILISILFIYSRRDKV
jgi:hypothetical protein